MSDNTRWPFYTEPFFADVHGLKTAYRRKGAGDKVVYFHGAGLTRRWLPFYEQLSERVDLIVPEHPGFGDTPFPEWLDGFGDVVLHYAEFLDTLGLDKVHLVGHSFGGWIAAEFASFFPERLHSLQLIAPAGLKGAFLHDIYRQTGEEALDRVFNGKSADYPDYIKDGDPVEAAVHDYQELTTLARLAWQPRHNVKLERRLARATVPVNVVLAHEDRIVDNDVARRYAEIFPNATVSEFGAKYVRTSHVPFVQEPEALANTLVNFISKAKE
jgi:pimeloyl-ACP methyl ester carboxylesterase